MINVLAETTVPDADIVETIVPFSACAVWYCTSGVLSVFTHAKTPNAKSVKRTNTTRLLFAKNHPIKAFALFLTITKDPRVSFFSSNWATSSVFFLLTSRSVKGNSEEGLKCIVKLKEALQ